MNKIECKLILNIGLNNSFLIKILHNIVFIVTLYSVLLRNKHCATEVTANVQSTS